MKYLTIINLLLTVILFPGLQGANFRFTNFQCNSLDTQFVEVKGCSLKMVRRSVVGMNFHLAIKYDQPINKIQINLSIFRKSNVYRLFLVNHTIDFCYYMRRPEQYPIFFMFHESLMAATNANHTCPYTESDIYVRQMTFNDRTVRDLLAFLPEGEYKLAVSVGAFGVWRLQINVYGRSG